MKLVVTLEVPEADPAREDPETVAEMVVDAYDSFRNHDTEPEVILSDAVWED